MNLSQHFKCEHFAAELEKTALKNPVAAYGIQGAWQGAGVGGGLSAILAHALLKNTAFKYKNPAVVLAAIAGAIAGAKTGGNIGAFYGGGLKGAKGLDMGANYGTSH